MARVSEFLSDQATANNSISTTKVAAVFAMLTQRRYAQQMVNASTCLDRDGSSGRTCSSSGNCPSALAEQGQCHMQASHWRARRLGLRTEPQNKHQVMSPPFLPNHRASQQTRSWDLGEFARSQDKPSSQLVLQSHAHILTTVRCLHLN